MSNIVSDILSANKDNYESSMLSGIDSLSEIKPFVIHDDSEYMHMRDIQSALESLSVYTINNSLWDKHAAVSKVLKETHKHFVKYNKALLITDKDAKAAAKYLVWSYKYTSIKNELVVRYLAKKDLIRKQFVHGKHNLLVIGLHGKVADNSFSVDKNGREHRQYMTSNANFAIPIYADMDAEFFKDIPYLSENYTITDVGNRKGLLRPFSLNGREKDFILTSFSH
jgi:hypothetical protein